MPNVRQLKERLEYLVDDTIEEDIVLNLFNEAQEDLSSISGYAKTAKLNFDKGMSFVPVPCDLIEVVELRIKTKRENRYKTLFPMRKIRTNSYFGYCDENELPIKGYRLFGNQIELVPEPCESGELLIYYYANLPELKSLDDYPVFDQKYHRLLPLFAAARYMQNWQGELAAKNDFYSEYLSGKAEMEYDFRKKDLRNKPRGVYVTRSFA